MTWRHRRAACYCPRRDDVRDRARAPLSRARRPAAAPGARDAADAGASPGGARSRRRHRRALGQTRRPDRRAVRRQQGAEARVVARRRDRARPSHGPHDRGARQQPRARDHHLRPRRRSPGVAGVDSATDHRARAADAAPRSCLRRDDSRRTLDRGRAPPRDRSRAARHARTRSAVPGADRRLVGRRHARLRERRPRARGASAGGRASRARGDRRAPRERWHGRGVGRGAGSSPVSRRA